MSDIEWYWDQIGWLSSNRQSCYKYHHSSIQKRWHNPEKFGSFCILSICQQQQNFFCDPIKLLIIHILRHNLIEGATTAYDAFDRASQRADDRIIWSIPTWPVLPALRPSAVCLGWAKSAPVNQAARTLQQISFDKWYPWIKWFLMISDVVQLKIWHTDQKAFSELIIRLLQKQLDILVRLGKSHRDLRTNRMVASFRMVFPVIPLPDRVMRLRLRIWPFGWLEKLRERLPQVVAAILQESRLLWQRLACVERVFEAEAFQCHWLRFWMATDLT